MLIPHPVPAAALDAIMSRVADAHLATAGFTASGKRRWIRSGNGIRHLFRIAPLKGGMYVPTWGISFDFVPHLKSFSSIAWHRTEKSAQMDLRNDPVDFDPEWSAHFAIDAVHGPDVARENAERVLPAAIAKACAMLNGVNDIPTAFAFAEWLRTAERPGRRFGFNNWIQAPLARAFLLARSDREQEGVAVLDEWIAHHVDFIREHDLERIRTELRALLSAKPSSSRK